MISELKLKEICSKYNINYEKLLNTNENILEYGDYNNICDILEYLINEIRIQSKNIEKCPSILYFSDLKNIKYNWEYLKEQEINTSNVMNCLHILSTEFKELKRTYQYVDYNYGKRYLNENTSILKVNIDRIQEIENNFKNFDKKQIIQASISDLDITEIEKIVKVCKEYGIEITGNVFLKTAEEIEKIVKVCKENGIEITGSVFKQSEEEIEKIVKVCKENGIEITGRVFLKKAEQLEENINYIKQNYGTEYVLPLIISKNNKTLKKVLPYLKEKGVLKNVKKSSSILSLSLSEIKERVEFIEKIGEEFVNSKGMFNSILGLSRKRYMIKKEEYEKNNSEKLKSEDMLKAIEGVTVEQLDKAEAVIQNLVEEQEKDNNPSLSED